MCFTASSENGVVLFRKRVILEKRHFWLGSKKERATRDVVHRGWTSPQTSQTIACMISIGIGIHGFCNIGVPKGFFLVGEAILKDKLQQISNRILRGKI